MASATVSTTPEAPEQEWKDFLEEILPPQGRWSEEEYLTLTDHRNRLIEFTDGFLEPLPIPTDKHQAVLTFLFLAFHGFVELRGGKVRFAALRLRVRASKFREPDVLLVLDAKDPHRQNRFWLGADLALEVVSEDKPERDLVDKRGDDAEGRVPSILDRRSANRNHYRAESSWRCLRGSWCLQAWGLGWVSAFAGVLPSGGCGVQR